MTKICWNFFYLVLDSPLKKVTNGDWKCRRPNKIYYITAWFWPVWFIIYKENNFKFRFQMHKKDPFYLRFLSLKIKKCFIFSFLFYNYSQHRWIFLLIRLLFFYSVKISRWMVSIRAASGLTKIKYLLVQHYYNQ